MAINFPATTGQPTDGSFTHTAAGVTYKWDGTSWSAAGVTGSYILPTASSTVLGGVKVGSNLTIAGDGTLAAQTGANVNCFSSINVVGQNQINADSNSDILTLAAGTGISIATNSTSDTVTITATGGGGSSYTDSDVDTHLNVSGASAGEILSWNGTDYAWVADQTGGGGGSGLQSRTSANAATASIANGASANIQITAAKTYALQKIQTSAAAWVTLYVSAAARTADASRNETTDPLPGAGVIAEVITSDGAIQNITPGTLGWNDESTPTTDAYLKVVNKSGSTQAITVTLHFVALEA